MERKNSSSEIEEEIEKNQSNINALHEINALLNKTLMFKSKYKQLNNELKTLKEQESQRKVEHDQNMQGYLKELEKQSGHLCVEHAKILHQIEHINWHLGHAHPHVFEHSHIYKSCNATITSLSKPPCVHKAAMEHLRISAERYVKSIAELRRKIFLTKQNLEAEIERKKKSEKNMTNMKKEISKQKKMMQLKQSTSTNNPNSNNNNTQLPPIANSGKSAK